MLRTRQSRAQFALVLMLFVLVIAMAVTPVFLYDYEIRNIGFDDLPGWLKVSFVLVGSLAWSVLSVCCAVVFIQVCQSETEHLLGIKLGQE